MVDAYYGWTVRGDLIDGLNKGITDVPVFYINEEKFRNKPTLKNLAAALDEAVKKSKTGKDLIGR